MSQLDGVFTEKTSLPELLQLLVPTIPDLLRRLGTLRLGLADIYLQAKLVLH